MKNKYIKPVVTVDSVSTGFVVLAGSSPDSKTMSSFDIHFADIDEAQLPVEADGNFHKFDAWDNE